MFSPSGSAIRFRKRDRIVCEANKHENLYILNESTVRTSAKIVKVPKVHESANSATQGGAEDAGTSSGRDKLNMKFVY